jgi:dynein heavy chain
LLPPQVLEDDSVSLSTMKASKFYASFGEQIDYWDTTLNVVLEVVDLLLTVQRKWMYLESIFMAGGDISKQLPNESQLFREVNDTFRKVMADIAKDPNAQRACKKPGLSALIQQLDEKLETIQKCLDQYLETKRMIFPRFYFVSDDDLLEILGQSRDPALVQKHIKKCFEGIKVMDLLPPGKAGNKTYEARAMIAPDNETADFVANIIVDGAVEMWLVELERAMMLSLQKLLASSLVAYKGKKEAWVRNVQGQLLITTGAIAWTSDCTKALLSIQNGNKNALKALKKKQVRDSGWKMGGEEGEI